MKHLAKRAVSLLLVLVMLAGLFTGMCFTAFAAQPSVRAVEDTVPCNVIYHAGVAPTCTDSGISAYYSCADPSCEHYGKMYADESLTMELTDLTLAATGHNYVGGICSGCGASDPTPAPVENYEGRYYIAAIRASGNYFYMTNSLGSASTKRYQAEDSGLTVLPDSITQVDGAKVFVLEKNSDGTYSIYAEGISDTVKYLGHTSGNSGTLVEAASALALTVDYANGVYNIHYTASDAERYLALNGTTNNNYFAWYKSGQKQDLVLIPVDGTAPEPACQHTNTAVIGAVAATCTAAGYTGDTVCIDCGETVKTGTAISAAGHNYEDGTCSNCGEAEPVVTDYSGRYYIAGIRSNDTNYQYIMGIMDGTRYDIEDSGLTELPTAITEPAGDKVFVIEKNADGTYRIYAEGIEDDVKYLGWASGNTGSFVTADNALSLTIDQLDSGLYNLYFYSGSDSQNRYLSLNATAANTYAAWYKSGQTKDLALIPVTGQTVTEPAEFSVKIGHTVSFDSDLRVNYRVKYTDLAGALPNYVTDGAYLVVEKDLYLASGSTSVTTVTLYPDLVTDENRMVFSLGGIQSVEMGSELRAVLHIFDANGKEYVTPVDVYSVLTYAEANIPTTTNAEFRTLLVDLLNYGASAQLYFGRNTDNLVNAGIDAYQQYATTELSEVLNDSRTYIDNDREITAVTAMGFSVVFADKTEMTAKLTLASGYNKSDITCVKVLNSKGEVVETITEFTEASDGRLQVTYYGVKSIQMREMFQFVAYVGDKVASQNVAYSVEAYVKSNVNSANTKLADMVLKCIYYGDSAYAYFTP